MKHFNLFLIAGLLAVSPVLAQKNVSVSGTVIDSATNKPIAAVTVALQQTEKRSIIKTGLTDENGRFQLNASAAANAGYQLLISYVGYRNVSKSVSAEGGNVGTIILASNGTALQNVTVTASRPIVKQEIDRLTYDVQADPQTKGQTALDMLRRVPLITVDGDDNIQLQGNGSFRIFINGKPSALVTTNPKDVLRAMPATAIQKIEVITTPPAKYDAEGLAGIINIITVKKVADGYNGTLSGRYNNIYGGGINLSGTAKLGSMGISLFGGYSARPYAANEQEGIRRGYGSISDLLTQSIIMRNKGRFAYGGFELSQEFDTLNLLTASLNLGYGRNTSAFDRSTIYQAPPGTILQSYQLQSATTVNFDNIDAGLNYQLGFAHQKDRLLTISYRYSRSSNDFVTPTTLFNKVHFDFPDNIQRNDAGYYEHTFQLDYVHPVKKLTVEAGAKVILRDNFSNATVDNLIAGSWVADPTRTNDFNYKQNIYSLYNSYSYKSDKWSFQAGLRAEHTTVYADFTSTATVLDMKYTNLIPTLSILKNLKNNNTLSFGITNRLMRPGISYLNPFVDKSNPQLLNGGNANLRPVISHLFELSYNKVSRGSLNLRLSYMYTNNSIESVVQILSDTVSFTTYDNVGQSKIARFNVTGNYTLGKKLSLNFNTGVFYVWIKGLYNGRYYSNQGPRTNTFANLGYRMNPTWQFGLSAGYNRRYVNLQGGSNDYWYSTLSATCNLKKFTLTASVNNPIATHYSFTQYTETPDFYQGNTSQLIYRTFNFNISYRFGKLTSGLKKNKRGINNDDTQAASN